MPLSNAERVAAWRKWQRENPEKYEEYNRKEKERYQKKKERGVAKPISDLGTRAQRKQRRSWRKNQQAKRCRDFEIQRNAAIMTPPLSPTTPEQGNQVGRAESMRRIGRQKVRRHRAKSYRELFKLRVKLREERRVKERYKKRCQRLQNKGKKHRLAKQVDDVIKRHEHKKALLVNQAIIERIRSRYMLSKSQAEKKMVSSILCSYKILKKLKLAEYARKKLGFSTHSFNAKRDGNVKERRKSNGPCRLKKKGVAFLCHDDNSRIKAGKKSTITRLGEKRQIHLFSDDLITLHSKFLVEESCKISYSLFRSLRPFHVVKPSAKDRATCQCKIHENLKFKLETCHQLKILSSFNIDAALDNITAT